MSEPGIAKRERRRFFLESLGPVLMTLALLLSLYITAVKFEKSITYLSLATSAIGLAALCPRERALTSGVAHLLLIGLAILVGHVFYDPIWGGLTPEQEFAAQMVFFGVGLLATIAAGVRDVRSDVKRVLPDSSEVAPADFAKSPPSAWVVALIAALASWAVWAAAAHGNFIPASLSLSAALAALLVGPERRKLGRAVFVLAALFAIGVGDFGYAWIWAPMDPVDRAVAALAMPCAVAMLLVLRWTLWFTHYSIARQNREAGVVTWPR